MSQASFVTGDGVQVPAVTSDQMREVDRIAMEETGPNLYQMMENAGRSLARMIMQTLGAEWRDGTVVVLAGTGGNGGGGICGARHLANHGGNVAVVLSEESRLRQVPTQQMATYRASGGRVLGQDELGGLYPLLIVDAVLGYNLSGPPQGKARHLLEWVLGRSEPVLALDVPSGIDSTTGVAPGIHVTASETMTLALPKTGLAVPAAGNLWLADIGIPNETYRRLGVDVPGEVFGDEFVVPIRAD